MMRQNEENVTNNNNVLFIKKRPTWFL